MSVPELSKRCKLSPFETKLITELVCKGLAPETHTLEEWISHQRGARGRLTTGDATLDRALGGGIRTGMVWEFVGERCVSAACLTLRDVDLKHLDEARLERHNWECSFLSSYSYLQSWAVYQVLPAISLRTRNWKPAGSTNYLEHIRY